jgi:hypothetical protein
MPTPGAPAEKTGKLSLFYRQHEVKITRAEVVIIFLALIRTITAYYPPPPDHSSARSPQLTASPVGRTAQHPCIGKGGKDSMAPGWP